MSAAGKQAGYAAYALWREHRICCIPRLFYGGSGIYAEWIMTGIQNCRANGIGHFAVCKAPPLHVLTVKSLGISGLALVYGILFYNLMWKIHKIEKSAKNLWTNSRPAYIIQCIGNRNRAWEVVHWNSSGSLFIQPVSCGSSRRHSVWQGFEPAGCRRAFGRNCISGHRASGLGHILFSWECIDSRHSFISFISNACPWGRRHQIIFHGRKFSYDKGVIFLHGLQFCGCGRGGGFIFGIWPKEMGTAFLCVQIFDWNGAYRPAKALCAALRWGKIVFRIFCSHSLWNGCRPVSYAHGRVRKL